MLGEKIGEISGKITMQRVLPNLGGDPKMETSFQATGSVLGANIKDTGTYTTIFRPDGTQYGEGQGIMSAVTFSPSCCARSIRASNSSSFGQFFLPAALM